MRYADIKFPDIANGPGVRVSVFVTGCEFHCPGCFNPEAWDFNAGQPFTQDTIKQVLELLNKPYCDGLTLLGGEPMHPRNVKELLPLVQTARTQHPEKSLWCYSGFTLEQLQARHDEATDTMLKSLDVLVDGLFVEAKKNLSLRFCGSSNQRLIDLPTTLRTGEVILWDARS